MIEPRDDEWWDDEFAKMLVAFTAAGLTAALRDVHATPKMAATRALKAAEIAAVKIVSSLRMAYDNLQDYTEASLSAELDEMTEARESAELDEMRRNR